MGEDISDKDAFGSDIWQSEYFDENTTFKYFTWNTENAYTGDPLTLKMIKISYTNSSGEVIDYYDCVTEEQEVTESNIEYLDLSEQFGEPDSDGYYHFTLTNAESLNIPNLPYGSKYEVIEVKQDGWRLVDKENDKGNITNNTTTTFTNEKLLSLTVRKETDEETDEEFEFEIVFPSNNSTYRYELSYIEPMTFALSQEVALANNFEPGVNTENYIRGSIASMFNKSAPFPDGWVYENMKIPGVTKTAYVLGTGREVEILDFNALALDEWTQIELYDNSNNLLRTHSRDNLQFNAFDSGEQFICTESNGASITSVNFIKNNESGTLDLTEQDDVYVGTFRLKKDEEIKFINIPYNTEYEVYEIDQFGNRVAIGDIFNTKWELKSKTNDSGTLTENTTSVFTNKMKKGSINVKKETKGNEEGEFKFKIKIWDESAENTSTEGTFEVAVMEWCPSEEVTYNSNVYTTDSGGSYICKKGEKVENLWFSRGPADQFMQWLNENKNDLVYLDWRSSDKTFIDLANVEIINCEITNTTSNGNVYQVTYRSTEKTIKNIDLSSQFGEPDENGYYEFTLSNNEEIEIPDIPFGYKYEVYEETTDGWELVSIDGLTPRDKASGTIASETPYEHTFLNAKKKTLTFGKEVTGNMGDKTKEFEFEVKIYGSDWIYNDEIDHIVDAGYFGATPAGVMVKYPEYNDIGVTNYAINLNYDMEYTGVYVMGDGQTLATLGIEVQNDIYRDDLGYRTFNKSYIGWTNMDSSGLINFTGKAHAGLIYDRYLTLSDYGGEYNPDTESYVFKLKHGETATIPDIPYGYSYEIIEKDYSEEGYEQKVDGQVGREVSGTLTEDKEHEFENKLQIVVPTKITLYNNYMYIIILLISIVGLSVIIRRKLKK